ncbi:MAG: hypothetical protein ACYDG2_25350, partial [Ruminiclostridium sp.]
GPSKEHRPNPLSKWDYSSTITVFQFLFDYYDDVLKDIGNVFDVDFSKRVRSIGEIKNILAESKK